MKHSYLLCILNCALCIITALSGCGQSVPTGFPAVVPVKITVRKDGKPLADVSVYCDAPSKEYIIGGQTDAAGVVAMRTTQAAYQKNGVPAGTYSVRLSEKIPPFPNEASDEDMMKFTPAELANYEKKKADYEKSSRKIPLKYSGTSSPVSLTVGSSACELEIDVEK